MFVDERWKLMVRPADNTVGRPYSPKLKYVSAATKFRTGCDEAPKHEEKTWSWIHKVQLSLNEQSELWKELYT